MSRKNNIAVQKGEISTSFGNYGLGRLTVDYNTPLNEDKTLLFQISGAVHKEKSFQNFGINKTSMIAPAITYKVNNKLTLDLDLEVFSSNRNTTYVGLGAADIKNLDDLRWYFTKSYSTNAYTSKSQAMNVFAKATYQLSAFPLSQGTRTTNL